MRRFWYILLAIIVSGQILWSWGDIVSQCFKIVFRLYTDIWDFLKANQKMLGITLLLLAETGVYYWLNVPADWQYVTYVEENIGQYPNLFAFIFIENLKVSGRMILAGLVPVFLGVLFSGALTVRGLVVTFKQLVLTMPTYRILLCTLPHGIFELPALMLSVALACILSKGNYVTHFSFSEKRGQYF